MPILPKTVKITRSEVLLELHGETKALRGFQGVDFGFGAPDGNNARNICLRVHLKKPIRGQLKGKTTVPLNMLKGVPVETVVSSYAAEPQTGKPNGSSDYLTSGSGCASAQGGGQISLMVVDRNTETLGFLSSWAAIGGKNSKIGDPIYDRPNPPSTELPMGWVNDVKIDRNGSAAFCEPVAGRNWLPIIRPRNLIVTALKLARVGDQLQIGDSTCLVDGVGIYRVRHKLASGNVVDLDIEGFRVTSQEQMASGGLIFDDQTATGAGLISAFDNSSTSRSTAIASNLPHVIASMGLRLAGFDDLFQASVRPRNPKTADTLDSFLGDPRETVTHVAARAKSKAGMGANRRLDIATVVWPNLLIALEETGCSKRRITDRIEDLDPMGGAHGKIANAVNTSLHFNELGIVPVRAIDFEGTVTFDQVCERLNDFIDV